MRNQVLLPGASQTYCMKPPHHSHARESLAARAGCQGSIGRYEMLCRRGEECIDLVRARGKGRDEPKAGRGLATPAIERRPLRRERADRALRQLDEHLVGFDRMAEPRALELRKPGAQPRGHAVRL